MPPLCPFGSSKSCSGHAWPSVSTNVVSNSLRVDQLAWKDLIGGSSFRLGHHEMPEEVQEVSVQRGTQHAEETRWNDGNWKTPEENLYFLSTLVIWAKESFYIISVDPAEKLHNRTTSCWVWSCRCPKARAKGVMRDPGVNKLSKKDKIAFKCLQIQHGFPWYSREYLLHQIPQRKNPEFSQVTFWLEELTAGFFEALASCGALPRRWHLDGRHGAIRCDPKMKEMRLLQLTPQAALIFQEFMIGKLPKSGYLTPNVMEYLQQDRDQSWTMHFWTFLDGILPDSMCFRIFRIPFWVESSFKTAGREGARFLLSLQFIGDEHPGSAKTAATVLWDLFLSGEREFDNHFETSTIKSPKGLWEVKCLAAAKNRSVLAAILYIQTYHCFGHVG